MEGIGILYTENCTHQVEIYTFFNVKKLCVSNKKVNFIDFLDGTFPVQTFPKPPYCYATDICPIFHRLHMCRFHSLCICILSIILAFDQLENE